MKIDIVGSIIITLGLMLICHVLGLGFFGAILLMIGAFVVMNNRRRIKGKLRRIKYKMTKKFKKKKVSTESHKSQSYNAMDGMEL